MGPSPTKFPTLCARATPRAIRVRSQPLPQKFAVDADQKIDRGMEGMKTGYGNRVMVVVDSSREAKGALQWALTHTVQSQDTIVLLHVTKHSKQGADSNKDHNLRAYELLYSMKNMCQKRRPGVQVEVIMLKGKEKGPIIVEEAKLQRVSLLILGQGKQSMIRRLLRMWSRNRKHGGVVEYCIQNASCMTIAVRRKSSKLGGYSITTKRHKKFWLLA